MAISRNHTPFQYSEYISPLPADDLIKIGTIKQQLYNEGVAKVQNQIDTLDQYGFSILKEEDKKYFSQEMDKFMKAINEGAAKTDFANINSLRDLLSVGRPLENDPLILNAIKASQEVQRRQQVISSLDPKDRGPANDYFYMQDVYDYLSDGKVGSKLSSGKEYMPYVDVNGKIASRIKDLKADTYQGLVSRSNGLLDIATVEELTNIKVAEAIQSELDEKELTQLQLNAKYSLKNLGPENIQQMAMADFNQRYMEAQKGLEIAIPKLKEARLMYQTSPTARNKELLDNAENIVENLNISMESSASNAQRFADINEVDDNLYYPYYLNNYITSKAREYSYKKEMHDYKPDELYMENLKFNHDSIRDRQKFEYDKQLEMIKSSTINPNTGFAYNNKPGKAIEGGNPTHFIPTGNGQVGKVVGNVPVIVSRLVSIIGALEKDRKSGGKVTQATINNVKQFAEALTEATRQRGRTQLKSIYEAFNKYMGKQSKGGDYNQRLWDAMYSAVFSEPANYIDPTVVKDKIFTAVVDPLTKVYEETEQKRSSAETRISINNSLNYDRGILDNYDFIGTPNILMDDYIIFGEPAIGSDVYGAPKIERGSSFDFEGIRQIKEQLLKKAQAEADKNKG